MRRLAPVLALLALASPAAARAATVSVAHGTLLVRVAPGEAGQLRLDPLPGALGVTDASGRPLAASAGAPCLTDALRPAVACAAAGIERVRVEGGSGDDVIADAIPLPAVLSGGAGNDSLSAAGAKRAEISGGPGADRLTGSDGPDRLDGGPGPDVLDGGGGADRLLARGNGIDSVTCGLGRDRAQVDLADVVDPACEQVDYGPGGLVGAVHTITGGGRFVPIPGQPWAKVDRRILPDVLYLVRRYHVRIEAGYSLSSVHTSLGEHPLGLATDIVPGPGGSWDDVDRLAHWAEPRQNHPRWPFRWVGYNGDPNHGRGNHLHLSWMHSPGHFGHPVRTVWVFGVTRAAAAAARAARDLLPPSRYVAPESSRSDEIGEPPPAPQM